MAILAAASLAALLGLASPALAGDCRLALVLAFDDAGSRSLNEDSLQWEVPTRTFLTPEVKPPFLMGEPVAVFVAEASGHGTQRPRRRGRAKHQRAARSERSNSLTGRTTDAH